MNAIPIESIQTGVYAVSPDTQTPPPIDPLAIAKELVDAMRAECRRLVEGDDFLNNLPAIENSARAMRQLVVTLQPVAALSRNPHLHPAVSTGWPPGQPSAFMVPSMPSTPNIEQFGARAIRELVSAMSGMAGNKEPKEEDPVKLVEAIDRARSRGLTALADRLEAAMMRAYGDAEEVAKPAPSGVADHQGVRA